MDILSKIGAASEAMAKTALAMQMAGEEAGRTAALYEDLSAECKLRGLNHDDYDEIASLMRGISTGGNFKDLVEMCLSVSEVCR